MHAHFQLKPFVGYIHLQIMTRMAGPDCAVMCNFKKHTHTHTHTHTSKYIHKHTHTHTHSCTRRAGNGGDTGGKRKKCRKDRVGSVAANPDNLESKKEAGGVAQGTQGSSKNCTSRESVSPL